MYNVIVDNYNTLKKGRTGLGKKDQKKTLEELGYIPNFVDQKIDEVLNVEDLRTVP